MTNNERNEIIAKCAALLDREAEEWNIAFFDFLDKDIENGADYAMTKSMTFSDAAEIIRMLCPDYKAKKDEEAEKAKQWAKSIREGSPLPMPNFKNN